ncbi:DUF3180 family protein [Lysinibacter sp. HNR]|uniref:DUF3180 family protein n=1 Tax=Lysinibacter sp. HNR TaxID=3031408 RepID=UPI002434DB25|nr:DUF3180 family protein [Lysinibacter sp. HNR]WGD36810.1 DUF3180 family protein [Lysinibacter sp. HNR]
MNKRMSVTALTIAVLSGLILGFLGEVALSALGRPMLVPPLAWPLTLILLAGILVAFAIPIRRSLVGKSQRPINPFTAVRVVAAAKASALVGSLFTGFGTGILGHILTRTVGPPLEAWLLTIATIIGGVVLLVAGLVVEYMCVLPPTDDGTEGADKQPA